MSIDLILSRLEKVKTTSRNSWMACCPSHDDRSPSLALRLEEDGRILLNCFAQGPKENILDALGVEFSDLFPQPLGNFPSVKRSFYPGDVLKAIRFEAQIVLMAAYALRTEKPLPDMEMRRLEMAMERINEAVEMANV
jgi:hypothetical protein